MFTAPSSSLCAGNPPRYLNLRRVGLVIILGLFLLPLFAQAKTAAVFQTPDSKSIFQIHRHTNNTIAQSALTANKKWTSGWSHLRHFQTKQGHFVVLVKNKDGKLHVREVMPNGSLGATPGTWYVPSDVTSVEVLYPNGQPVLMVHVRSSGQILIRKLNANGSIGDIVTNSVVDGLVHKDIVKPYKAGNRWYLFAYARFYGSMHIYSLDSSGALAGNTLPIHEDSWTKGWSNVEFYESSGRSYAILYKNADVFGQHSGGKIGVKRINSSDGSIPDAWHQRPGDGKWSKGYTEFKIFKAPAARGSIGGLEIGQSTAPASVSAATTNTLSSENIWSASTNRNLFLLVYKVGSGKTKTLRLGATGIGDVVHSATINKGWHDMAPMYVNGNFYLAKVNEDSQARALSPAMTERFADAVRNSCPETAGFQFGLSQHGQLQHLEGGGFAKIESGAEKLMSPSDRHGTASVGKMLTAYAFLKMVDEGIVGFNDQMLWHLPDDVAETKHADYYFLSENSQMHNSVWDVRLSELATYTSRFGQNSSSNVLSTARNQEACADNNLNDPGWLPNPHFRCNRGYQNSAYGMLGFALMHRTGIPLGPGEGSIPWQNYNHNLWMNDIHTNFQCNNNVADTNYYETCDGGEGCANGLKRVDPVPADYCLSGSWRSNTEDLMRFLWAVRYGKGLSKESHELLVSRALKENAENVNSVFLGWNGTHDIEGLDATGLGKAGGSTGTSSYILHLPYDIDASIIRNTSGLSCTGSGDTLEQAFEEAIN